MGGVPRRALSAGVPRRVHGHPVSAGTRPNVDSTL